MKIFFAVIVLCFVALSGLSANAFTYNPGHNSISSNVVNGANAAAGTPKYSNTGGTSYSNQNGNVTGGTLYTGTSNGSNAQRTGIYAAMGDSVASGAGLAALSNASGMDTTCGRSSQSYPYLVAQQTGLKLINATCSGAVTNDFYTAQHTSGTNPNPQLDTAFSQGTPELITITVGANDVHWVDFIRACYASDCASDFNQSLANFYIGGVKGRLQYIFSQIQSRSNGSPPTVVVTGYYNPVSNYCKDRQNYVTNNEIDFLNQQRDSLNKTIRDAASPYNFIKYASADFTGHGICADEPWSQTLTDTAPLHPNAAGQQHIASSILEQINGNNFATNN